MVKCRGCEEYFANRHIADHTMKCGKLAVKQAKQALARREAGKQGSSPRYGATATMTDLQNFYKQHKEK